MVDGLTQAHEEVEDVRVIVEYRARLDVTSELNLALRIQCLVVIKFAGIKTVPADDCKRKQYTENTCGCQ